MRHSIQKIALLALGLVLTAGAAGAQDPKIETDVIGEYVVSSSVEMGVRGRSIDGSEDKYRSDLNYGPGFRFFDSSFRMEAEDGSAPLFDSLLVRVTGFGGDPSGYMRVDAAKLDWYRFDGTVRRFDYYNRLTNIAEGEHLDDIEHTIGDFNLLFRPQSRTFRFNANYSFDRTSGPSITTYDYSRDEFPLFAPTKTAAETFAGGFDAKFGPVDFTFQQGYRRYKDDTLYAITEREVGNSGATVLTFIDSLNRDLPTRGSVHFTRMTAHTFLNEMVDITGRFVYSFSSSRSNLLEVVSGADFLGNIVNLDQYSDRGFSERPDVVADIGVSVFATDRLTISNTFGLNWYRIEGGRDLTRSLDATPPGRLVVTRSAGRRLTEYRRYANLFELDYEFHSRFSAHAGYRYTDRRITAEPLDFVIGAPPPDEVEIEEFDNRTNTFMVGAMAKPLKKAWTVYVDYERGENDNVFTRTGNYDYWDLRVRNRINVMDTLGINVSGSIRENDNPSFTDPEKTPIRDFGVNSESRNLSASVDWTPNRKVLINSGYTYNWFESDAVIFYFFNFAPKIGNSQYFVRNHSFSVSGFAELHPRVSVYGGYRINDDAGAGDREPGLNTFITEYPYRYQSPEVRVAIKLHDRLDLNLGYTYYDFEEQFLDLEPEELEHKQDYTAHLPVVSLRFYFGRKD